MPYLKYEEHNKALRHDSELRMDSIIFLYSDARNQVTSLWDSIVCLEEFGTYDSYLSSMDVWCEWIAH